jgi:thiol-disulfide isomerase/thioredoxin
MKLLNHLKNYYSKKSKLSIAGDILLAFFVLVMIIPTWRRDVGSLIVKPFMRSPKAVVENVVPLTQGDLDMTFVSLERERFQLKNFIGKPVFVTWWATWCHHCVAELAQLQQLVDKVGNSVHILILTNENPVDVKLFLEKRGYTIPIYAVVSYAGGNLDASSLPTSFAVNSSGKIVFSKSGATKWGNDAFIEFLKGL